MMSSPASPARPPSPAGDGARSRARAELLWYMRHADALARWPVLAEPWALRAERRRLERAGEDITAATFSMGGR